MGEILMPAKWVPAGTSIGDSLEAFIYFDSEDRPIATTLKPYALANEFAWLKVKSVERVGAFLDWGLDKDLLVPFKEQKAKMEPGRWYMVFVYVDPQTQRVVASAKLEKFFEHEDLDYEPGQEVDVLVWTRSELGFKAIVNQQHLGLIYANEIFQEIRPGQQLKGFIHQLREDGKIDLRLQKSGYENVIDESSSRLLKALHEEGGFLPLTDKSDAEDVYDRLQMSKKTFKKALGSLYKQKLVLIQENGISLVKA